VNRELNSENQAVLIAALVNPACYPHSVESVQHLETHISHILLAGDYAYKIKKPLNLGFLDFTSLERRRRYCLDEVRLNRRLAPQLYLNCIPIGGSVENPRLGGEPATALEYAIKMRRFSQTALLDRCLAEGRLQPRHIDALARQLAAFHGAIARADPGQSWGVPAQVQQPAQDNFDTHQPDLSVAQRAAVDSDCRAYLELAAAFTRPSPPFLLVSDGGHPGAGQGNRRQS
jgi:aminoglycoside phosphotransferase family enzyme